jgi:hypothetical protein
MLRATLSASRSSTKAAFGRPAPRIGVVGTLLVKTTSSETSTASSAYGPGNGPSSVNGRISPYGR